MITAGSRLNRFERVLLVVALAVSGVLVLVRVGAMVLVPVLHHFR